MTQQLKGLRVVYVTTEPTNQPRLRKIGKSLSKFGADFVVFRPTYPAVIRNRTLRALIKYIFFLLQAATVNADVVWVSNCPDITALPFALTGRRYVYDFRSPWSKELAIEYGRGLFFRLSEIIEKTARRYASVLVVVSRRMVRDVSSLGTPVFVVPNYPLGNFSARGDKQTIRKGMGVSDQAKIAIFVGRLTKIEGADLLEDVARALSSVPEARLWVVGDGPLGLDIKKLELKYPSTVRYFGWVPHHEVPDLIVASDVSIMPRHRNPNADYYSEEGVHKISESIWLGTPVIACNVAESSYYTSTVESRFVQEVVSFLTRGSRPALRIPSWEDVSEPVLVNAVLAAAGRRKSQYEH
ncbi:MAG: glycosyltransferase [Nitrososphaerota archaeon]|jgi:glycosyltransferase involved in cell wall biosynthesis|nr:glycosyltransferase [Nitrososphaerota archaeon]